MIFLIGCVSLEKSYPDRHYFALELAPGKSPNSTSDRVLSVASLRISPRYPEFRRGMLHDWNPVGLVSVGLASVLSLLAFAGLFGDAVKPFSVLIAISVATVG